MKYLPAAAPQTHRFRHDVNPDDYSVGVYIFNDGWWPKPTFASPWTEIQSDGSWQCDIVQVCPTDLSAAEVMAFLVPKTEILELAG